MSQALNSSIFSRRLGLLFALSLCFLAGCVDRSTDGRTSIYMYSLWFVVTVLFGGVWLVYLGFTSRPSEPRWRAYRNIVLGLVIMAVTVPVHRADRVEVDKEHFLCTQGMPWNRHRHDVRFDALREIRIEETEYYRRFQRRKDYTLICQLKSGNIEMVHIGIVMKGAVSEILGIARQKGISLVDVEQLPAEMRPR